MGSTSSYESEEDNEEMYHSDNSNYDIIMEEQDVPANREALIPKEKHILTYGCIEVKKDMPNEKELHWITPNFLTTPRYSYIDAPVFTFLNVRWYLRINPCNTKCFEDVGLDLRMDDVGLAFNMLCTFAIKKPDDSLDGRVVLKHMFSDENLMLAYPRFFDRDSVWTRNSTLMTSDKKLTIVCNLKQLPYPTKLTELHLLSDDIKSLFTDEEFYDVILRVKDREFKAHKVILAARSPVFASYFQNETMEEQNDVIDIPDCDPYSFPEFLEYLYSGKLENISFRTALNLYRTANNYDVPALKLFCVEHMEQNLDIEYFFDVLSLTELADGINLFNAAQKFFNRNLNKIFATSEWKNLMKSNSNLANKLLMGMSSDVQVVSKRRRLQ